MRGLVIRDGEVAFRDDLPSPRPPSDVDVAECRVRVTRAGICATDLALARGYMDFEGVPGHEFVGVALDGPFAGRRVVGEINAACGTCAACARGDDRHCPHRSVLGILGRSGAFAEELMLPQVNLRVVPDEVPDDHAVFAEPLAAAFAIAEAVDLVPGTTARVLGDGRLGLLCAQVLALHGLSVLLHGRHPERAQGLSPRLRHAGAIPERGSKDAQRMELVVEATGDPSVLQDAIALVAPRGALVLKTTAERPASLDLAPLVVDEIRLVGSRCGRFQPALDALARGEISVAPMIHARFPLHEGVEAFATAGRPGTLKVLLDIETS